MEFFELVKKRHSVRKFKRDEPVADDDVHKILAAAIEAPTAGNEQCWRFYVIRNPEIKKRIAAEAGHQLFIDQAPVAIVVAADLDIAARKYGDRGRHTYAIQDTAAAVENILLAANALGYGACWVGAFEENVASKVLDLPGCVRPLAIVPIGIPDEPTGSKPVRKKLEDVTKFI
jgi:nitroreductase